MNEKRYEDRHIKVDYDVWEYLAIIKIQKGFKTMSKALNYLIILATLNPIYLKLNDKQKEEIHKLMRD